MPEVHFTIRWPDGLEERCYSPSTAIREYLAAGKTYPLPDFLDRARAGLKLAALAALGTGLFAVPRIQVVVAALISASLSAPLAVEGARLRRLNRCRLPSPSRRASPMRFAARIVRASTTPVGTSSHGWR